MTIKELLNNYVNQKKEPRKIGRYWATDIQAIKKGTLTPKNFFEEKPIDEKGIGMILVGSAMEKELQEIFSFNKVKVQYQNKYEIPIDKDVILVVKPDFEFDNFVIETKFPFTDIQDTIPDRYFYQLEAEHRATQKDVYLGILEVPFNLRLLQYTPSIERWLEIQDILIQFHKQLKNLT